jgi:ATP-dependent DNA ligase
MKPVGSRRKLSFDHPRLPTTDAFQRSKNTTFEGIVAKRKSDPYRRGVTWWKIKNRAYRLANDGRGDLLKGDERMVRARRPRAAWAFSG